MITKESEIKRLEDALKYWASDEWKDEPRRGRLRLLTLNVVLMP